MADRPALNLQSGGHAVVSSPNTGRGKTSRVLSGAAPDMSVEEMEKALVKYSRRPPESIRGQGAPQTARALLEENKQLVQVKQQRKAMERKNSRQFIDQILADDRMFTEADKAKQINRRCEQRELAGYYKARIAEKEAERANEYNSKLQSGICNQFFPFVEGEHITKNRQVQADKMRDEMRGFLQKQREECPPRRDQLIVDTAMEYQHRYPTMAPSSCNGGDGAEVGVAAAMDQEVSKHLSRHPRFLSRAREHMSRRIHDQHVRKALEDKVERTKSELEQLSRKRQSEALEEQDGRLVNDALRYDSSKSKGIERRRNAEFLESQMKEKETARRRELEEERSQPAGYMGPEEKEPQGQELNEELNRDLIMQMSVNQHRRLDSRHRRLRQEKRLIDNSMAEMWQDREKEKVKLQQHREVLTTTWDSQQKIREAKTRVECS